MSVSRVGAITAAVVLVVAGVLMLRVGFLELSRAMTLSEVAGPTTFSVTPDPQLSAGAPAGTADLVPTRVRIPSIQVDAGVVDLGVKPDRTLEVPEDISVTGWYTGRSVPGEMGPSVLVGHIDSAVAGAGVFFNLRHLEKGDTIEIERSDGSVAKFRVTSLVFVDKKEFPTKEVYGLTDQPTLRLITCGGSFDRSARSYLDNVIVYAEHIRNREPAHLRSWRTAGNSAALHAPRRGLPPTYVGQWDPSLEE